MKDMKIVFTHHAEKKFKDLEKLGIYVKRSLIKDILKNPIHIDIQADYPKKIASGELDKQHLLRIVFREENDTIIVITFYPAKKGRYF